MIRTTTRTEQVEVCATCNDDLRHPQEREWHWFTCPQCLREFCKNVGEQFEVRVSHLEPRGWPITADNPRITGRQATSQLYSMSEYEFKATFCSNCTARIKEVLTRAGLTRATKPDSDNQVTLD